VVDAWLHGVRGKLWLNKVRSEQWQYWLRSISDSIFVIKYLDLIGV